MPSNNNTAKTFTVNRKARTGRSISDETTAARKILSDRFADKTDRATVNVVDPEGKTTDTYSALVVEPKDVGKPVAYTGMIGLIAGWAKATGVKVKVSKVSETHYAIRPSK